jgi:hypothetical protein
MASESLLSGMPDMQGDGMDAWAGKARQAGYTVEGNEAVRWVKTGNSQYAERTPLSAFAGQGASFLDQAGHVARKEYERTQEAADRQHKLVGDRIDLFEGSVKAGSAGMRAEGQKQESLLGGMAQDFNDRAQADKMGFDKQRDQYLSLLDRNTKEQKDGIRSAVRMGTDALNKGADQAVATAQGAVSKYDTNVQEGAIRSTLSGLRADADNQIKQIQSRNDLPDSVKNQMIREVKADVGRTSAQTASTVRVQAQETLAGLKMNLAGIQLEAGKTKGAAGEMALRGEGMLAQAGDNQAEGMFRALQASLQSEEGQRAWANLSSGVQQFSSQLTSGLEIASLQAEMSGMSSLVQMHQNNPESVVSMLSAFMALGGIASSPGGRAMRGINLV